MCPRILASQLFGRVVAAHSCATVGGDKYEVSGTGPHQRRSPHMVLTTQQWGLSCGRHVDRALDKVELILGLLSSIPVPRGRQLASCPVELCRCYTLHCCQLTL